MVDVVQDVLMIRSELDAAGADGYTPISPQDVSFLYSCRTRISEVGHVFEFLKRYVFSGEMTVSPRGNVAAWVDWRRIGYQMLEQFLLYGMCFVSYDKENREPIIWEVSELDIRMKKTIAGHVKFKVRIVQQSTSGLQSQVNSMLSKVRNTAIGGRSAAARAARYFDEDESTKTPPQLVALVNRYPEAGRIVSMLMPMQPILRLLLPPMYAALVATIRTANPQIYYETAISSGIQLATHDAWRHGDGREVEAQRKAEVDRKAAELLNQIQQAQAPLNRSAMSAMQIAYQSDDVNSAAIASSVVEATIRSPAVPLPAGTRVAAGPQAQVDMKFLEFVHQLARQQISEAFGLPPSIFTTDSRYMTASVAGFTRSVMESTMNQFSALVRSGINQTYRYVIPPAEEGQSSSSSSSLPSSSNGKSGSEKEGEGKRDVPSDRKSRKRKLLETTAEEDVVKVEILRRIPLEEILLLKPELKRESFISMLAETLGIDEDDFEPNDRVMELEKAALTVKAQPKLTPSGSSSSSKPPRATPSAAASMSSKAISKLK